MAKAHKLPSGKWRVRVYSHTDNLCKKHYESFTGFTKQEAELMAAKFANNADKKRASDITIKMALERYIEANDKILSPSTIRGYKMDAKRLAPIEHIKIRKLDSFTVQSFIKELSVKYAPKTIKNTYALLITSLSFSGVETNFMIHLPTAPKRTEYAPENEQIKALIDNANPIMRRAIVLAACYSLRRGEICGLKYKDIIGNQLYVHSDIVKGVDGWVHKDVPKTDTSNRTLLLTEKVLQILGTGASDDYIVPIKPETLDRNFDRLRKKLGLNHIRFHGLRSYFTSVAVINAIPDIYTAHMSGHKENSPVLKEHYQKKIVSMDEKYKDKMNDYFDDMLKDV